MYWLGCSFLFPRGDNIIRLGIDGVVNLLQLHFIAISGRYRIQGLQNVTPRNSLRYSSHDSIDP
jgi:hypothetical protein